MSCWKFCSRSLIFLMLKSHFPRWAFFFSGHFFKPIPYIYKCASVLNRGSPYTRIYFRTGRVAKRRRHGHARSRIHTLWLYAYWRLHLALWKASSSLSFPLLLAAALSGVRFHTIPSEPCSMHATLSRLQGIMGKVGSCKQMWRKYFSSSPFYPFMLNILSLLWLV